MSHLCDKRSRDSLKTGPRIEMNALTRQHRYELIVIASRDHHVLCFVFSALVEVYIVQKMDLSSYHKPETAVVGIFEEPVKHP